jgi:predicted transcriptional regulator
MPNTNIASNISDTLPAKPVFVPKRRTPYLMQEEVIKHKEESEAIQRKIEKDENEDVSKERFERLSKNDEIRSQLAVKKESTGIQKPRIKKSNTQTLVNTQKLVVNQESVSKDYNLHINYHEEVGRLYGIQKKIAHFFVQSCLQRNQNNTGPVTAETLCRVIGSTKKTIKKIIQRMIEKKLIERIKGKSGKGGFSTYVLDAEFINVLRLQLNLELDHVAINSKFIPAANIKAFDNNNSLPESWEKIDLTSLTEAFKTSKNKQFFGKTQLKSLYSTDMKLSVEDLQNSISAFAYGLKNHNTEEPYVSMINPAAVLYETLKNGDKWEEKRFLSPEENTIYKVYLHLFKKTNDYMKNHYKKWVDTDRNVKFEYYRSKMGSTQFYNEKVFEEKSFEDYEKNIWPIERDKIILDTIGISNKSIIDKIKLIVVN